MRNSILAGIMISIGAALYLVIGGIPGAILFSIGLLTILYFQFHLFTGKAGLFAEGKIRPGELCKIWCGNLIGCAIGVIILTLAGLGPAIIPAATAILATRISNIYFVNMFLGVLCGILMYIAVNQYEKAPYMTIMCVAAFILLGANHCIADMVYTLIAATPETIGPGIAALIWTTIGNVIGCNLIPSIKN